MLSPGEYLLLQFCFHIVYYCLHMLYYLQRSLFALLSTLISIQYSLLLPDRPSFPPQGSSNFYLIWSEPRVSSEQSLLCFWLRCSLFSFSSSLSSSSSSSSCAFLPACLSARGEATASLHAVNRSASERARGRAGEDSWYGSTSETQPNKASPVFTALPCSSTSAAALRLSNPLSQFVHFLLWFCFHGGIFEALIRKNTC